MTGTFDALQHIDALIAKGWRWSTTQSDVLLHPQDHSLRVRYNRMAGTLSISPALEKALDLVIPTPPGKSRSRR